MSQDYLREIWLKTIRLFNFIDASWRIKKDPMMNKLFGDMVNIVNDKSNLNTEKIRNFAFLNLMFTTIICEQYDVKYDEFVKDCIGSLDVFYLAHKGQWEKHHDSEFGDIDNRELDQKQYYDALFERKYVRDAEGHFMYAQWFLKRFNPQSVLDVGSGAGYFLKHLHGINPSVLVVNTDISEKAFKQHRLCESVVAELSHLPFKDNSFQYINCGGVLEHLTMRDAFNALDEFDRVAEKKVCFISLASPGEKPYYVNREHQLVAPRKWLMEAIGGRKNWCVGGLEDLDYNGEPDAYGRKGVWTFVNWRD